MMLRATGLKAGLSQIARARVSRPGDVSFDVRVVLD